MLRGGEFCSPDYIHYILLNQDLQKYPPLDETDLGKAGKMLVKIMPKTTAQLSRI
jgi:hypothetical protein